MASFYKAIPTVFKHEGGWVDDIDDAGGATNLGISLRFYKKKINPNATKEDIRALTYVDATGIYKQFFWDTNGYEKIDSQLVASKVFDLCVNMGAVQANKCLQLAINSINPRTNLLIDGQLGAKSLNAINLSSPNPLYHALVNQAKEYYKKIAKHGNNQKFLRGWLNRAEDII